MKATIATAFIGVTIAIDVDRTFELEYVDAPFYSEQSQQGEAVSMLAKSGLRMVASPLADQLEILFSKAAIGNISTYVKLHGATVIQANQTTLLLEAPWGETKVEMYDCQAEPLTSGEGVVLTITSNIARLVISQSPMVIEGVRAFGLEVSALTHDGTMHIQAGRRIPEFSISVFDDEDFTRARPLRFGVPVISTVPVFYGNSSSVSDDDKYYYDSGIGASERTMYFRVVCHDEIDASLPAHLLIWPPLGLDTVAPPVSTPLTRLGVSDGQTLYKASYRFHKEDTVNYVDGFAYLSVFIPMSVQTALPILLSVGAGAGSGGSGGGGTVGTEPVEDEIF